MMQVINCISAKYQLVWCNRFCIILTHISLWSHANCSTSSLPFLLQSTLVTPLVSFDTVTMMSLVYLARPKALASFDELFASIPTTYCRFVQKYSADLIDKPSIVMHCESNWFRPRWNSCLFEIRGKGALLDPSCQQPVSRHHSRPNAQGIVAWSFQLIHFIYSNSLSLASTIANCMPAGCTTCSFARSIFWSHRVVTGQLSRLVCSSSQLHSHLSLNTAKVQEMQLKAARRCSPCFAFSFGLEDCIYLWF